MTSHPVVASTASAGQTRPSRTGLYVVTNLFAVVGGAFGVWQIWTLTAWLLDGPVQVTQFRDSSSASYWAARVFEVAAAVCCIVVIGYLVRDCRRARRLTLDAKIALAVLSAAWLDPAVNAMEPTWMYSSNWVNLKNWLGHMPFVINPDAGRMPEPIIFIPLVYFAGIPAFVFAINRGMRLLQRRQPDISLAKLASFAFVLAMLCDVALEAPMYFLRLWANPGIPDALSLTGGGATKYSIVEVLAAAVIFTGLAMVRWLKDDRGRSLIVEQQPATRSPFWAQVISLLALVGVANTLLFLTDGACLLQGFYASPYKKMPAHLVNELCDAPGYSATVYGRCPGSPGFSMPIRVLPHSDDKARHN